MKETRITEFTENYLIRTENLVGNGNNLYMSGLDMIN
jgi:hypothetical protein